MVHDMCTRRLTRELRAIQKAPLTNPTVHTTPLDSNILEWHYVIEGHSNSPFEGGYYWGKLIFPKEYPLKPPSVMMLTKNGRFHTGKRLCLSMSDFHPGKKETIFSLLVHLTGLSAINRSYQMPRM
jgi:ubiquitin-conjugating enzyme E2 J2